jgi:peroxiredoxin
MIKFRAAGMQPFGVNPASPDSHRKYADKMRFGFRCSPMLTARSRRRITP